jgi:GxxExxY protein
MIHHEGTKDTKDTKDTKEKALVVSQAVLGGAIEVHRQLGPGLLESVYECALCRELWLRGLRVEHQVPIPVSYKGAELGTGIRVDLLIDRLVIVEIKACEQLTSVHRAQLLTYLKLTGHKVGLLINFNVELLRHGMRRVLNG